MPGRALNILVVEDDDVQALNVRRAISREALPHQIWVACDGAAALELLRGNQMPRERRLVLLDLNMPRMNGIEVLRLLRADAALRSTTVVVFTSSSHAADVTDAYDQHVAGYLLKPSTAAELAGQIAALTRYWALAEMP